MKEELAKSYTRLTWDELCLVHAVANAGTLSGAARALDVSHPTAFRRLNRLERKMGVRFFDRARDGYTATAAAEEVSALVRRMSGEILAVERRIAGRDLRPKGTLRITTTDTLLFGWLTSNLRDFRIAYPEIQMELVVSNAVFSLSKREADIALRPAERPDETLVGRRVGTIAQAVYMARQFGGAAKRDEAPDSMDWIGPDESLAYRALDRWLTSEGLVDRCRIRANTVYGMLCAARAGLGLAVLPCYLGENDEQLVRVGRDIPSMAIDLWILTHPDLRKTERVRLFMDYVAEVARRSHFGSMKEKASLRVSSGGRERSLRRSRE